MEKSYVYQEDEYEEGLTFKKVGHFFAKGWLRMLVWMLAFIAVATVIVLPIKFYYKSEAVAQTTIEFVYEGIETGKDPNGGTLNTDNIISTTVLANAIRDAGLSEVITDVADLRESMRVEGVETDEYVRLVKDAANGDTNAQNTLRNYTMYPTRFNIIISKPKKLGLSDTQAKHLLNKIVASYYENFKERYSVTNMFAAEAFNLSDTKVLEFTDIYDVYKSELSSVEAFLTMLSADASDFVSTKNNATFASLISTLNTLNSSYGTFNSYILTNNVWRDRDTAESTLAAKKVQVTNSLTNEKEYAQTLQDLIKSIQPSKTTIVNADGSQTVTETYPSQYYDYIDRLDNTNIRIRTYNEQLSDIDVRLDKLNESQTPSSEATITTAESMIKTIETRTAEFINKVNETVTDYYDTTFISSSVRQTRQPVVTRKSSALNVLIIYAVVIVAGLLVGGIITGVKIAKANSRAKANCEKANETETDKKTEE